MQLLVANREHVYFLRGDSLAFDSTMWFIGLVEGTKRTEVMGNPDFESKWYLQVLLAF